MNSFKNVRELLLLSYVINNVVSDREFVLYDAYQSKNPDFNYQQYDQFNLDNIDSAECKAEFRIERADIPTSLTTIRGGSRVQRVRTPPPRDDLRFSNKTGILPKKNYGVYWY